MNEETKQYIYDYDNFSFKVFIADYWDRIYNGKPRNNLYYDYRVMLDVVKKVYRGKWILDVGVNNGLFAIPASMLGYKVVGFEPIKSTYDNIIRARVENNLDSFHIFDIALSNEIGEKTIYVPECTDNASFSVDAAIANMKHKEYQEETVWTTTFDKWIELSPQYSNIGLIKIDAQGSEYNILEGMREFLTNASDIYIICEYENHLFKLGHTFEQLDELIASYGFVEQPKILNGDKFFYKP